MSKSLADRLDLKLAWRRMLLDRPDRCFVEHPFQLQAVQLDLDGWIECVSGLLVGGYQPRASHRCLVPKPNWMVRPADVLDLEDELVYNALVGSVLPHVISRVQWSQGKPDIAYRLQKSSEIPKWTEGGFHVWKAWREKSLELLDNGAEFLVVADIAAFYENIDLSRLSSDLRSIGSDPEVVDLLMRCLGRWADPRGKGIPQGYSASDILAKLYFSSIDVGLKDAGFAHLRYVDDIRIFCSNALEAKRALLWLEEMVRRRGLNLQSAKTRILRADEARKDIDGVAPTIEVIDKKFRAEIEALLPMAAEYASLDDIEEALKESSGEPSLEVLERAFEDYFINTAGDGFNKTLFHYLLVRLGREGSTLAVAYCVGLLSKRPEETSHVLDYLSRINVGYGVEDAVVAHAASRDAIYDYQLYQIVRWFSQRTKCPKGLLDLCRRIAWDRNRLAWLRSFALAIVEDFGTVADHERAEAEYQFMASEMEKADCAHCLRKLETGRRNAFYGRIVGDGDMVMRAVQHAKTCPL